LLRFFVLALVLVTAAGAAETIRVDVFGPTHEPPEQFKPGFFYNNTNYRANGVFDTSAIRYNTFKTFDIAYKFRNSSDHATLMGHVRDLESIHEHRARGTDRLIIAINGMPWWLSRSSDTTSLGEGWRYYHTVGPGDYAAWDSIIKDIAREVRTWDFTPYYELWNEPNNRNYWNGSEVELIQLYRHTAEAIKSVHPQARVGGFGMHAWYKGTHTQGYDLEGWYPDTLAEETAALAHLIDTCALGGIPLDFISWHIFSIYPYKVDNAAWFLRRKLDSAGMYDTEMIMDEYNTAQESRWQPGIMLNTLMQMARAGIDGHAFAAYQDFSDDPSDEFHNDWGSISRGGLCKPVYKAFQLLSMVERDGRMLQVEQETDIPVFAAASRQGNRVRLLVSNGVLPAIYAGREELLYSDHRLNTYDLAAVGYTSMEMIDSTIMGLREPHGPPEIVVAFRDAQDVFNSAALYSASDREFGLRFTSMAGSTRAVVYLVDEDNNNVIFRYDSLIAAGWTRSAAVDFLRSFQDLVGDSFLVVDSTHSFVMPPNAVALIELHDVQTAGVSEEARPGPGVTFEPIASYMRGKVMFTVDCKGTVAVRAAIRDATGRTVRRIERRELGRGRHMIAWDGTDNAGRRVGAGVYMYALEAGGARASGRVVLLR
jgi:hypothetical protein